MSSLKRQEPCENLHKIQIVVMNMSSTINGKRVMKTKLLIGLITLLSIQNAFAYQYGNYRSHKSCESVAADEIRAANEYQEDGIALGLASIFVIGVNVAVSTGATITAEARRSKAKKTLQLIREAKTGAGILLSKVRAELKNDGIIISTEEIAERIATDSDKGVYCMDDLYSYAEVVDYLKGIY